MALESKLAAIETPERRRFEVKINLYDCFFLILGSIGLALSFPPLIYLSAVGHVIAGMFLSPVKWLWLILTPVTIGITAALFFAAVYAIQYFYHDVPSDSVLEYLQLNWLLLLASAVVVGGISVTLFAYPGNLDQLREHMDKS